MKDAKEIAGCPGYFVTKTGKVYSNKRGATREIKGSEWQGYIKVKLSGTTISVHRLVAQTFLKKPSADCNIVNHKDGNKSNNNVSNLEWTTHRKNMDHYKAKLSPTYVKVAKEKKQQAILRKLKLISFSHEVYDDDPQSFHTLCDTLLRL